MSTRLDASGLQGLKGLLGLRHEHPYRTLIFSYVLHLLHDPNDQEQKQSLRVSVISKSSWPFNFHRSLQVKRLGVSKKGGSNGPSPFQINQELPGPSLNRTLSTSLLASARCLATSDRATSSGLKSPQAATSGSISTPGFTGYSKFCCA